MYDMDQNYYLSDYGTGSSSNSSSPWSSSATFPPYQHSSDLVNTTAVFESLISGRCTLDDIMTALQMNNSPPKSFEDKIWGYQTEKLVGMGPSSAYLRQKSWPAPDSSPALPLPRHSADWAPPAVNHFFASGHEFTTSTPVNEEMPSPVINSHPSLTEEQRRVLNSLPNRVVFSLLQAMEQNQFDEKRFKRHTECRFCKNNGERESYYRSHALKDSSGRVACPVLRAFVCRRCGASGDTAHTTKYCPLTSADERKKSAAMMRSVRLAAGRRRQAPAANTYVMFGDTSPTHIIDNNDYNSYLLTAPLEPSWAALEQKLSL